MNLLKNNFQNEIFVNSRLIKKTNKLDIDKFKHCENEFEYKHSNGHVSTINLNKIWCICNIMSDSYNV